MPTAKFSFASDHPAAGGHFPGNPIIPGAVLLNQALQAIQAELAVDLSAGVIKWAKFLHPVRPGDCVTTEFSSPLPGTIEFSCTVRDKTVLTGAMTCAAIPIPA
jgi:3-hydroxymyristoyl/3-hydroxydecanoyl-(acyl carrier protein) dehydratase